MSSNHHLSRGDLFLSYRWNNTHPVHQDHHYDEQEMIVTPTKSVADGFMKWNHKMIVKEEEEENHIFSNRAFHVTLWLRPEFTNGQKSHNHKHKPNRIQLGDIDIGTIDIDLSPLNHGFREISGWYHILSISPSFSSTISGKMMRMSLSQQEQQHILGQLKLTISPLFQSSCSMTSEDHKDSQLWLPSHLSPFVSERTTTETFQEPEQMNSSPKNIDGALRPSPLVVAEEEKVVRRDDHLQMQEIHEKLNWIQQRLEQNNFEAVENAVVRDDDRSGVVAEDMKSSEIETKTVEEVGTTTTTHVPVTTLSLNETAMMSHQETPQLTQCNEDRPDHAIMVDEMEVDRTPHISSEEELMTKEQTNMMIDNTLEKAAHQPADEQSLETNKTQVPDFHDILEEEDSTAEEELMAKEPGQTMMMIDNTLEKAAHQPVDEQSLETTKTQVPDFHDILEEEDSTVRMNKIKINEPLDHTSSSSKTYQPMFEENEEPQEPECNNVQRCTTHQDLATEHKCYTDDDQRKIEHSVDNSEMEGDNQREEEECDGSPEFEHPHTDDDDDEAALVQSVLTVADRNQEDRQRNSDDERQPHKSFEKLHISTEDASEEMLLTSPVESTTSSSLSTVLVQTDEQEQEDRKKVSPREILSRSSSSSVFMEDEQRQPTNHQRIAAILEKDKQDMETTRAEFQRLHNLSSGPGPALVQSKPKPKRLESIPPLARVPGQQKETQRIARIMQGTLSRLNTLQQNSHHSCFGEDSASDDEHDWVF